MTHTPNALEEVGKALDALDDLEWWMTDNICIIPKEIIEKRESIRAYMAAQADATKNKFNIGDIVQVSPNCEYYEDWKGVKLEIVGIYRAKPFGYSTPNETPPIKYSVKDIKDNWNYGFTDDFNGDDLLPAPTMQGGE